MSKKLYLGQKVWFAIDGIIPVEAEIKSKTLGTDRLSIVVYSPIHESAFRIYETTNDLVFLSKKDLEDYLRASWYVDEAVVDD